MDSSLDDAAERLRAFPDERFEDVEPIGEGGHAVVFRAFDRHLHRHVAIKLSIHDALPDMLAEFGDVDALIDEARAARGRYTPLREARMMARVDHPGVVSTVEVGRLPDGAVAVIMPLLEGGSLADRDGGGRWRDELRVALQIGQGLAAIHRAGLLHRDLKPDNVLFDRSGRPRIADLALACELDDIEALTERVGTPHYMSPEVLIGEPFDVRDDIYAYCFLVFEQFYGHDPFASIEARLRGVVSHIHRPGGIPRRLRRALVRGLHPRREHRWQDMGSLLRELRRVQRPASGWGWAAAGGVACLALVGALVSTHTGSNACEHAADELNASWGADVEAELRGAFGTPEAGDALRDWASRWIDTRTEECERALRTGEPSRRSPCTARARERFEATVEAFRVPHLREGLDFAAVITELPAPERCLEHPEDPGYADGGLLALRDADALLGAQVLAGERARARDSLARYMELARTHGSAYGLARGDYWSAELSRLAGELDDAQAQLEQVYDQAELLDTERLGGDAALALAKIAAARGELAALEAWAFVARTSFAHHEPERVALALQVHGLALLEGEPEQRERGVALLVEAVERSEATQRRYGGSREPLSLARESLARGFLAAGRAAEAREILQLAFTAHEREFGASAQRLNELRMLSFEADVGMGKLDEAQLLAQQVFETDLQLRDGAAIVRDAERIVRLSFAAGDVDFSRDLHAFATRTAHRRGPDYAQQLAPLDEELRQLMIP